MVHAIPEGFHSLTPYLVVNDAARAMEWYRDAFGAEELGRSAMSDDDPRIINAMMRIGDSIFMLNDAFPEWGSKGPDALGGSPVSIVIYSDDVDQAWKRAVDAGATVHMELADQFWGDRFGSIADPFGHQWSLAQHIEDVPSEEMDRRRDAAMAEMGGDGSTA